MSVKTLGPGLIIVGALGLVITLLANSLRIGSDPANFGWLQTLGAVLCLILIGAGIVLTVRKTPEEKKRERR